MMKVADDRDGQLAATEEFSSVFYHFIERLLRSSPVSVTHFHPSKTLYIRFRTVVYRD